MEAALPASAGGATSNDAKSASVLAPAHNVRRNRSFLFGAMITTPPADRHYNRASFATIFEF
jgi:hypothetical protein